MPRIDLPNFQPSAPIEFSQSPGASPFSATPQSPAAAPQFATPPSQFPVAAPQFATAQLYQQSVAPLSIPVNPAPAAVQNNLPPAYQVGSSGSAPMENNQVVVAPAMVEPSVAVSDAIVSARDLLIAKAKAFKETQSIQQRYSHPEQLSMNVDYQEQQSLEDARRMAREVLSSPFSGQNLEVPAFIRKRQGPDVVSDK